MDGYKYVLELVDRVSGPAKQAKSEIERLTEQFEQEAKALAKLEEQYKKLQSAQQVDIALARKMQGEIAKRRSALDGMGNEIRDVVKKENESAIAKRLEAAAAKEASSATGRLDSTLKELGASAGAAAAGLLIVAAAVVGLVIGGAKIALDAAKFKAQTIAALSMVKGVGENARGVFFEIRKISDEIGISEAKAQKLGLTLLDAGVTDMTALSDALRSIALLEKVRGEEAGKKLEELVKKSAAEGAFKFDAGALEGTGLEKADVLGELAKRMKLSTAEVEAQLKAGQIKAADGIAAINSALNSKLGGAAQAKGLSGITGAAEKAYELFTRLFEDINTQPLIDAVKEIGTWLDASTPAGEALKFLLTSTFEGIFSLAKQSLPWIKIAFLELVIVALKIYIGMKPVIRQFVELKEKLSDAVGGGAGLESIIRTVVDASLFGLQILVSLVGFVVQWWTMGVSAFIAVRDAATAAWDWILSGFEAVKTALGSIFSPEGGSSLASGLITGLVGGITGGAGQVVAALTNVGQGAINSVKSVLGIASPSKVMAEMGGYTAEGFAMGVEDGTARTQGALESAVTPNAATEGGGGGGAGAGVNVTFEAGSIVIQAGGASPAELAELLVAQVADKLEELLLELGGAKA